MGEDTKIEWTNHTFNPWIGCQKVSPGCDHCYAERDWITRFLCIARLVFDNAVPPAWRHDLFKLIGQTSSLDWLLLTKRPQNITRCCPPIWGDGYSNVWLGTTTEDEVHYRQRWPILARIPAVICLISYEPAIGPLGPLDDVVMPDWIICGGESGPNARMMEPMWARQARDQCHTLGVAFFMKQMTARKPIPADLVVRQLPTR
jgi:protein gp37